MRTAALTIVAVALALGACGDAGSDGGAPDDAGTMGGTAAAASRPGDNDAVAAVQSSPGTPVARLQFVIQSRPVVGEPFVVRLLVSGAEPGSDLGVTVESSTLDAKPQAAVLPVGDAGTTTTHELTVTSREQGLAELGVRLKVDAAETLYAIPVLVPAG